MMRLPEVARGEHLRHRILYALIRVLSGHRASDVVRTLKYHQDFFGAKMMFQDVMRGPSPWSIGERELFAAFVSKTNECEF